MNEKRKLGNFGEELATQYLKKLGYQILARNYFCRSGEIDIIAKDKIELVFIEVKTRTNQHFGPPIDAIDERKRKHLLKTITYYLYTHHLENSFVRVDAIEVFQKQDGDYEIHHIKQIV